MAGDYSLESIKVEHFKACEPRDYDAKLLRDFYNNSNDVLRPYVDNSYGFTARYKRDIIAIGGLMPIEPGKAEAWMFTASIMEDHRFYLFKTLKRHIDKAERIFKLRRIQSLVVADFIPAQRFIERLGFHLETPNGMLNYGPHNETYYLYARTKNWYNEDVEQRDGELPNL